MAEYQPVPEGKDPVLWDIAQKRAGFKKHLITYLIVNAFLWALWYLTSGRHYNMDISKWASTGNIPWPIWPTLGWGIGLAFNYAGAYMFHKSNAVETEYEKLKNQQTRK